MQRASGLGQFPTRPPTSGPEATADAIVAEARHLIAQRDGPILIALDGGSGSGKSTLAHLITGTLDAALVQSDDFITSDIPDAEWYARTPSARVADALDWQRLRTEALESLLTWKSAKWQTYDFEAARPDGTYPMRTDFVEREPRSVIVLDGLFSTRPELSDLIDLSVLVDAPVETCHKRLSAREEPSFLARWYPLWSPVERWYLEHLRPASSFDLVRNGVAIWERGAVPLQGGESST